MVELAYTADSKSAGSYPMRVRVSPAAPFLGSSMAESAAVNRVVVGSNPTRGAKMRCRPMVGLRFLVPAIGVRIPASQP